MGKVVRRGEEVRQQAVNILKNGGSIEEAAAATGYKRDYVRQLGAKEGIRFPRGKYGPHKTQKYDKDHVIALYHEGKTPKEVASVIGCSESYVCTTWKAAGLKRQLTHFQRAVKNLRERGFCSVEIAEELSVDTSVVNATASSIGMPFTEGEKQKAIKLALEKTHQKIYGGEDARKESSRKFIEKNHPGFTYISGLIGGDDVMTLACNRCGSVVEKSAVTVRRKGRVLICPECARIDRIEREREREASKAKRDRIKQEKKQKKFWTQDFNQIVFKTCPVCGTVHLERSRYCSDGCRRKALNQYHDKRLNKAGEIDKTITLQKLYSRDGGVCWICGCECDWNDYRIGEHGNKIAGNSYPSIDHFIPLAVGGNHTWDNVRLAHRRCNSKRGTKAVS